MLDKEFHIRFTLVGVAKILLFSPFVIAPVCLLVLLPWGSSSAPAWVQAIGSVMAIIVGVRIASRQHDRDQEWRISDRAEQNYGLALRLDAFVTEYHRLVCNVLPKGDGNIAGDQAVARLLEDLKARLDSNFDDDLDHARQVEISNTRSKLAAVIFTLRHRFDGPEGLRMRAEHIELSQQMAEESLKTARELYRKAHEDYMRLKRGK